MAVRYVEIGQYPDVRREVRGNLSEILVSTANPGTYAAPEDVTGCFLEMGVDGKWDGASVGTMSKATADALYASGALANLATGATYREPINGTQYTYDGEGVGWRLTNLIVGPFANITEANVWAAANPSSLFPGLWATSNGQQISWGGAGVGWVLPGMSYPAQTPNVPATVYMVANDLNSGSESVASSRQIATELFSDYMFDTGAIAKATQTADGSDSFPIFPRFSGNNANNAQTLDSYSKDLQFVSSAAPINQAATIIKSVKMSASPQQKKSASFIKTLIIPENPNTFYGFRTPFIYAGSPFDSCAMYVVGVAPGTQVIKCSIVTSTGTTVSAASDVVLGANGWITFSFPANTSVLLTHGVKYYLQMRSSQFVAMYPGPGVSGPNNTEFVYVGVDCKPMFTTDSNGVSWASVGDSDIGGYTIQAAFYRNTKRFALLVGDSVTAGAHANPAYPQALRTLALKEDVDFSGSGSRDIVLLGTATRRAPFTFSYPGTVASTYSSEGRGGWTLYSYLRHSTQRDPTQANWDLLGLGNGSHTDYTGSASQRDLIAATAESNTASSPTNPFFDDSLSGIKFSVKKLISRYRTLDDAGNRLAVGSGTGTLIDSGNVGTMDICTPTDVFVMLGHNDFAGRRGTIDPFYADIRGLISRIRADLPSANIYIGITIPLIGCDSKQFYPNYADVPAVRCDWWKQNARYWTAQNDFSDSARVFAVPMYWVTPTAEAFSVSSATVGSDTLKTPVPQEAAGWFHPNSNAHDRYAGQIYSAMRYANHLDSIDNGTNYWP